MDNNLFTDLLKQEDLDLRPYQREHKRHIYELWQNCRAVMLQMPTGTGKTRLFVSILRDLHRYAAEHKKQIRVLILVHRVELIDQISDELGVRYGLAHGFIHSQDRERRKFPFQIASVQTLNRRIAHWSDYGFDFIIVDEAHHVLAESYKKIIQTFPSAKVLGVTATPYRLSGVGFRPEFDELIVSPSIQDFIDKGYLSNYEYYSIRPHSYIENQLESINKTDASGDYDNAEVMKVCDKDRIRAEVVNTYLEYAKNKRGIVYTINKKHNQHLCEAFCAAGIPAVAIDSDTDTEERNNLIEDFKRGKIKVLCNVDIFSEGFDCPDIEFVQLARPTKSLSLYLQQVGRGLRISEGKKKVIFLDNVGLYNRFGVPAAPRFWEDYFEGIEGAKEQSNSNRGEKKKEVPQRRYERDLSEGNEKIHLIHSSLDDDFAYERAKIVWDCYANFSLTYLMINLEKTDINNFNQFILRNKDNGLCFSRKKKKFFQLDPLKCAFVSESIEMEITDYWLSDIREYYKLRREEEVPTFSDIEVEIVDDSYYINNIYSSEIDSLGKYIFDIKKRYDKFCIGKYNKYNKKYFSDDWLKKYTDSYKSIVKYRIGKEERTLLHTVYSKVAALKDESKRKELFSLQLYMDQMKNLGNPLVMDEKKLSRYKELSEEVEKIKHDRKKSPEDEPSGDADKNTNAGS